MESCSPSGRGSGPSFPSRRQRSDSPSSPDCSSVAIGLALFFVRLLREGHRDLTRTPRVALSGHFGNKMGTGLATSAQCRYNVRASGSIVTALQSKPLSITATCFQYHEYGRRTGLKIRSSQEGVGSGPTFGTDCKMLNSVCALRLKRAVGPTSIEATHFPSYGTRNLTR